MPPIISVITPYTSDTEGLKSSIKSLQRQVDGFDDHILYEHIIVGQTDTDMPDFGYAGDLIRVAEMDFWSYSGAVAAGIKIAKGKYITVLCAGSVYHNKESISDAIIRLEKIDEDKDAPSPTKSDIDSENSTDIRIDKEPVTEQTKASQASFINKIKNLFSDKNKAITKKVEEEPEQNIPKHADVICCETLLKQSDGMMFLRSPLTPKSISEALQWFMPDNIYLESIIFSKEAVEGIEDIDGISRSITNRVLLAHCIMQKAKIISHDSPLSIKPDKQNKDDLPHAIASLEDQVRFAEIHGWLKKLTKSEKRKIWNSYYTHTENNNLLSSYEDFEEHIIAPPNSQAVTAFLAHSRHENTHHNNNDELHGLNRHTTDNIKNIGDILDSFNLNEDSLATRETQAAIAEIKYRNGMFFDAFQETQKILKHKETPAQPQNGKAQDIPNKVVVFYSQNPYPTTSGADTKLLSRLQKLKDMKADILLCSFNNKSSNASEWTLSSIEHLRRNLGIAVEILKTQDEENTQSKKEFPIYANGLYENETLQNNFTEACKQFGADTVLIFNSKWGKLIEDDYFSNVQKAVDINGFASKTFHMSAVLDKILNGKKPPFAANDKDIRKLTAPNLFSKIENKIDAWELKACRKFDHVITSQQTKVDNITNKIKKEKIKKIPTIIAPNYLNNTYDSAPIFTMGKNNFSIQGYIFFMNEILPLITPQKPDFTLSITGSGASLVKPTSHVKTTPYVKDYKHEYSSASFAISPIIGNVGQQMRIIEAMANGIAVIVLSNSSELFPIKHGENGFIAKNAAEFAELVLKLYMNSSLCKKAGRNARKTIENLFFEEKEKNGFSFIFQ
ncbi:MAG: glycosyltransferase family 4 protein [Alphaproteobacteria bacterium]|nr:glycosyltransferase family 4 protein [Alphaproteobacteria bacterium]